MSGKHQSTELPSSSSRAAPCAHCGQPSDTRDRGECRCACGNLLGRLVAGGIELKCRRCKRIVVVAIEPQEAVM